MSILARLAAWWQRQLTELAHTPPYPLLEEEWAAVLRREEAEEHLTQMEDWTLEEALR